MLRFSANLSLLFTELPLIQRFHAAKQAGFNAVEIQFPYELTAAAIRHELNQHHLKLVLFNVAADDLLQGGEGLASVPEKQADFKRAVAEAVAYANILQPDAINILAGCSFEHSRLTAYETTFKDNLRYALDYFSPLGINTVFEAINTVDMPDFMVSSSQHMLAILAEINHPKLLMQYDCYHMQTMQEENLADFISRHAHQIGHIQFADSPHRHEPNTGDMDYSLLFNAIKDSNYQGWVGAEYKPLHNTLASLEWLRNI